MNTSVARRITLMVLIVAVLGERRAREVKQYLEDLGVPASQLQVTSYGNKRTFCTEHSEACWQSNCRAHFLP